MSNTSGFAPPELGEPYLLTPGPLTTSAAVKRAMLCDWGSWDDDFRAMTRDIRNRLVSMLGDTSGGYECVPIQGSGTYAVEAMLGTFMPQDGKALVLSNGAYGQRAAQILDHMGRAYEVLDKGDYLPPRGVEVQDVLRKDQAITHVVAVHCETSSGILNPVDEISAAVSAEGREMLIDAMSSFGAIAIDPSTTTFQALASSANKCIEGVPGFGFVLARRDDLVAAKGNAVSLCLDLEAQWSNMEATGQWRFTPPTHTIAAFAEALDGHEAEGGVPARYARYSNNCATLVAGMKDLGFETLLDARWRSPIIVTFFCPDDPAFEFGRFYDLMKEQGFIIYTGKLTVVESFRIGCIGHLDAKVMSAAVEAVKTALDRMGVQSAAPPAKAMLERARLAA